MTFKQATRTCLSKYAEFHGRAARPEYWWFVLFTILGNIAAGIIDAVFGFRADGTGLVGGLFSLAMLLPSLAVASRRLHDIDRSFWWVLVGLIPVIGWLVLLYWFVQPGTSGSNRFGSAPAEPVFS